MAALQGICNHSGTNIGLFDGKLNIVPDSVVKWAELKSSNGELPKYMYSIAELNDKGKSFKYLADIIRKNYEQI